MEHHNSNNHENAIKSQSLPVKYSEQLLLKISQQLDSDDVKVDQSSDQVSFTSFENNSFDVIQSSEQVQKFYQHLKGRYEKLKEENKTLEAQAKAVISYLLVMKPDIDS